MFNPFTSTIVKVSTQTENTEVQVDIPSREGLTIRSEVSILYNIVQQQTPSILRNIGMDYENTVILPITPNDTKRSRRHWASCSIFKN